MVDVSLGLTRTRHEDAKLGDLLIMQLGDNSLALGMKAVTENHADVFIVLSSAHAELPLPMLLGLREIKEFVGLKLDGTIVPETSMANCIFGAQQRDQRDQRGLLSITKDDVRLMVAIDKTGEQCWSLDPRTGVLTRKPIGDIAFAKWSIFVNDASGEPHCYLTYSAGKP